MIQYHLTACFLHQRVIKYEEFVRIIHGEDMPAFFVQVGFQALYMTGWSLGAMVGVGPPKTGS